MQQQQSNENVADAKIDQNQDSRKSRWRLWFHSSSLLLEFLYQNINTWFPLHLFRGPFYIWRDRTNQMMQVAIGIKFFTNFQLYWILLWQSLCFHLIYLVVCTRRHTTPYSMPIFFLQKYFHPISRLEVQAGKVCDIDGSSIPNIKDKFFTHIIFCSWWTLQVKRNVFGGCVWLMNNSSNANSINMYFKLKQFNIRKDSCTQYTEHPFFQ